MLLDSQQLMSQGRDHRVKLDNVTLQRLPHPSLCVFLLLNSALVVVEQRGRNKGRETHRYAFVMKSSPAEKLAVNRFNPIPSTT
jgi:hypothetical protein